MDADMAGERVVLDNHLSELGRMTQWLHNCAAAASIPEELVYKLDVAANEAVTNIICYAFEDAARHEITLHLKKTPSGARLVIKDDGKPFNFLEAPEHQTPIDLEGAVVGGLGIRLIRCSMTRCDYRRDGGFNILSLDAERNCETGNA